MYGTLRPIDINQLYATSKKKKKPQPQQHPEYKSQGVDCQITSSYTSNSSLDDILKAYSGRTNSHYRDKGVATICGRAYLRMAKDLGYRASVFNLVFDCNKPSIRIWKRLGFTRIGTIPKCAKLKNIDEYVDAHIYYYDLTQYDHSVYPMDKVFDQDFEKGSVGNIFAACSVLAVLIAFLCMLYIKGSAEMKS